MAEATPESRPAPAAATGEEPRLILDDVPEMAAPTSIGAPMQAVETADGRTGLKVERYFTQAGAHPYDQLTWELRDAVIKNWRDGTVSFEQRGVEFPTSWSMNATTIVAQKYFR